MSNSRPFAPDTHDLWTLGDLEIPSVRIVTAKHGCMHWYALIFVTSQPEIDGACKMIKWMNLLHTAPQRIKAVQMKCALQNSWIVRIKSFLKQNLSETTESSNFIMSVQISFDLAESYQNWVSLVFRYTFFWYTLRCKLPYLSLSAMASEHDFAILTFTINISKHRHVNGQEIPSVM